MIPMAMDIRWQDLLDIAIIALVIYRLLLLLVDTRAMQLVKGMLVLALAALLAKLLQLEALSWVVGKFMGVLLFTIPVIFQPELRRLLEELGRGNIWRRRQVRERAEPLADEVLRALLYLQTHRIGALLIFQRETGLRDVWRSGVRLNAEITQETIVSVFWHGNPLHDGAAIFDREHILAAACYLPLTEKSNLSRWYGTRHRAALGVTEVSDAIALVVSEERGEVALATNGHLSKGLKEPQLRKLLLYYFLDEQEDLPFFDRMKDQLRALWSGGDGHEEA